MTVVLPSKLPEYQNLDGSSYERWAFWRSDPWTFESLGMSNLVDICCLSPTQAHPPSSNLDCLQETETQSLIPNKQQWQENPPEQKKNRAAS